MVTMTDDYSMEELVEKCAPSTWKQVFWEVDRLTRDGQILLSYREDGVCALKLCLLPPKSS